MVSLSSFLLSNLLEILMMRHINRLFRLWTAFDQGLSDVSVSVLSEIVRCLLLFTLIFKVIWVYSLCCKASVMALILLVFQRGHVPDHPLHKSLYLSERDDLWVQIKLVLLH